MLCGYLGVVDIKGLRKTVGCPCTVLRRTKLLCKMCPFLEERQSSSLPTNEAILKGGGGREKLIQLILGGSLASVSILDKTSVCRDPCLASQNLLFLLTPSGCSNCAVIFLFVNKSISLLYLNNRDRYLLWEPVLFFGLVRYFDVSQRK